LAPCPSEKKAEIAGVLCPLSTVPLILGVVLNDKKHIAEASLPVPEFPVIFTKGEDALAGPYEDIPINKKCTDMDYEGELCVVIGKEVKDFSMGDDPLQYVLGYTVGNDVSSRHWQINRSGDQHGTGKSFDKFAPLGPVLVSPPSAAIKDTIDDGLLVVILQTRVNGKLRQDTSTGDLLFRLSGILEY
jgi:2-keto-4-pentenoate hydratase/2-oxohepta-3-ene-1,7-dioic acid hydratase in catechol pathway